VGAHKRKKKRRKAGCRSLSLSHLRRDADAVREAGDLGGRCVEHIGREVVLHRRGRSGEGAAGARRLGGLRNRDTRRGRCVRECEGRARARGPGDGAFFVHAGRTHLHDLPAQDGGHREGGCSKKGGKGVSFVPRSPCPQLYTSSPSPTPVPPHSSPLLRVSFTRGSCPQRPLQRRRERARCCPPFPSPPHPTPPAKSFPLRSRPSSSSLGLPRRLPLLLQLHDLPLQPLLLLLCLLDRPVNLRAAKEGKGCVGV
jgi:hypothetical protein